MSGLGNLVRVHQWILDEKRQQLAELQQMLDEFKNDLEIFEKQLESEREFAGQSHEGTVAFQSFVTAALERRKALRGNIAELERQVEAARDEVGSAFQELKKYETALEVQRRHEEAQRRRREQIALDELGVGVYRRGRAVGER